MPREKTRGGHRSRTKWSRNVGLILVVAIAAACTADGTSTTTGAPTTTTTAGPTTTAAPTTTTPETTSTTKNAHPEPGGEVDADIVAAALANAPYQDVAAAEAAGYENTLEGLGCFESVEAGGMGVHFLRGDLMDDQLDVRTPEALVYEMGPGGEILGLIAHEYIVPVEAWTSTEPPRLFGVDLHQHPVLPLWVLHVWLWKDNPSGMFTDFNPKARLCPEGVPVFGIDRP